MPQLNVTDNAVSRVNAMRSRRNEPHLHLRLTVEGGGCSGFQYIFRWDTDMAADDRVFADAVVSDETSLPFLDGATLDYAVTLMGEDFKVTNPNAASGCGCGTSFAI
jgi:iron-sulfur cluster insertion protein